MEEQHSLDLNKAPEQKPHATAGQAFIKSIGPAGMALFLILAVLVTWICLTAGRDPIPGYSAPETTEYYAAHPEALAAELEENVFPALPAEYGLSAEAADGAVSVTADSSHFVAARAALLRYFDAGLLVFPQEAQ